MGMQARATTQFSADLDQLDTFVDWTAVGAHYWADPVVKERKQAEFLVQDSFPWTAIAEIGVSRPSIAAEVRQLLAGAEHEPRVLVMPEWYY